MLLVLFTVPFAFGHHAFVAYAAQGDAKDDEAALAAKGKTRYDAYKCSDCHGANGEGTPDGPDLTHSRRTREQVSAFLRKPSSDAVNKGMPDIPLDSPDHAPLVAYVMSIRAK
jgi:mono/diheme cytochrome c family protein